MHFTAITKAAASQFRAPIIAVFSGSCRKGSVNTKLAYAAEKIATGLGAQTKFIDLGSYDLPLYNQDLESEKGMPPAAMDLKDELASADGWIMAAPEYNGSITPLIANSITWCSRGDPDGAPMYATFKRKAAVVLSASPGAMGGMRALNPNRQVLQNLGVNVLPESVAVGGAFKAFDENTGDLVDERHKSMLESAVSTLFFYTRSYANREATCELIRASQTVGEYGDVQVAE